MIPLDPRQIARILGGTVVSADSISVPGPNHGPRDRSLSIRFDPNAPDGFIVFSHAGDDPLVCKDHVRGRIGLPAWAPRDGRNSRVRGYDLAAIKAESVRRERNEDDWKRIKRAQAIWCEAVDPRNTPAEQYLRSRALVLDAAVAGNVLRYHPACPWRDENIGKAIFVPAVIAAFRSIDDNEITAIQRVAVTKDGTKISRRMIGLVYRAAVKLDPATDTLAIAEGVETAMAARMLGYAPAWALGSVGMISKFPVLDGVTCLRILGETGKTSAEAVQLCGSRWHRAGRKVQVVMPSIGSDLNDELIEATA